MDNTINSLSFKARIRTLTKIKNKAAFTEINQIFKKGTNNNKKDILYITNSNLGESIIQLSHFNKGILEDYSNADIAIKDINKAIDSMSPKEFANKLVKIFKALKAHEEANAKIRELKSEILRAKSLMILNKNISSAWASEGKGHISKRYDILASKNNERIEILTKKLKTFIKDFNTKIDNMSSKHKELAQLKF